MNRIDFGRIVITTIMALWLCSRIVPAPVAAQVTIPTRTPTAAPTDPPPDPPPATQPPPAATNTPPSAATPTATPTPPPTATPTALATDPATGFLPTALPCGDPPTATALDRVNVRNGPGTAYESLAVLLRGEVRPVVGRAEFHPWWVVVLDNGSPGWVADFAVGVSGYTGNVPLAPAPPLTGGTPTPGAPWQPTPAPFCTVTPTATATATELPPTSTPSPAPPATQPPATAAAAPGGDGAAAAPPVASPPPLPDATTVARTNSDLESVGAAASATATPAPLPGAVGVGVAPWLVLVGAALVIAGSAGFVLARRGRV